VHGVVLEDWLAKNISAERLANLRFIKIDTEGYDRFIVKSIAGILKKYRPILQVELYPALTDQERIDFYQTLRQIGYVPYFTGLEGGPDFTRPVDSFLTIPKFCDVTCLPE
jgi:hypothetical protein